MCQACFLFFLNDMQMNSWQALIITNGQESYSIFTYQCGKIQWHRSTVIGYNAAGTMFENYLSTSAGSLNPIDISCLNLPSSNWTSILYNVSGNSSIEPVLPPTIEPRKWICLVDSFILCLLCQLLI